MYVRQDVTKPAIELVLVVPQAVREDVDLLIDIRRSVPLMHAIWLEELSEEFHPSWLE